MKLNKHCGLLLLLLGMTATLLFSQEIFADSDSIFSIKHTVPAFSLPTLNSSKDFTSHELNSCASLVVFWASWCGTCREEHAFLMKIHAANKIPVFGIDYMDNPVDAKAFLSQQGNPYKVLALDLDGQTANQFGIKVVPESFLVDQKGKILYHHIGPLDKLAWEDKILPLAKSCQKL